MQRYLDSQELNWHITGSYAREDGAVYTSALDLTDAQAMDHSVTGRLGGFMSDGTISFAAEADQVK